LCRRVGGSTALQDAGSTRSAPADSNSVRPRNPAPTQCRSGTGASLIDFAATRRSLTLAVASASMRSSQTASSTAEESRRSQGRRRRFWCEAATIRRQRCHRRLPLADRGGHEVGASSGYPRVDEGRSAAADDAGLANRQKQGGHGAARIAAVPTQKPERLHRHHSSVRAVDAHHAHDRDVARLSRKGGPI
jgi:hypothetical protein